MPPSGAGGAIGGPAMQRGPVLGAHEQVREMSVLRAPMQSRMYCTPALWPCRILWFPRRRPTILVVLGWDQMGCVETTDVSLSRLAVLPSLD